MCKKKKTKKLSIGSEIRAIACDSTVWNPYDEINNFSQTLKHVSIFETSTTLKVIGGHLEIGDTYCK